MNVNLDDVAISLINHMNNMIEYGKEYESIIESANNPSALIEKIDVLQKNLDKIQKTVSVMMMHVQSLRARYKESMCCIFFMKEDMLTRIAERKSKDVQMNTMASVYEEGNYITDFTVHMDEFYDDNYDYNIMDLNMDTVIDPHEYSVLSLVNKMDSDNKILLFIENVTTYTFDKLYEILTFVNSTIISIIGDFLNGEYLETLCTNSQESMDRLNVLKSHFQRNTINCYKEKVSKIFNIYLEIAHNYSIYDKAVNSYRQQLCTQYN